jgi:O-6-methylguanine DNA methyltransferase
VPIDVPGTDFQTRVWDALREIPFGETRSYEALADAVGSARAVRAVGRANGMNRVSIVIPCHRVIGKDGGPVGYGGGFYDAFFPPTREDTHRLGVAFALQVLEDDLPAGHADLRVDTIVTERETIRCLDDPP